VLAHTDEPSACPNNGCEGVDRLSLTHDQIDAHGS
jgi:hypothetical protein